MSRLRAFAQLVRLPNVFTALADICLGALATSALSDRWPAFAWLLTSSACLYCSGMVWNDFFDVEQDRRERPFRPIPSGVVSRGSAARLGTGLSMLGVFCALLAGWNGVSLDTTPALLACLLVVFILLYDYWLKHTWAGPLGMGMCRFLNVLLGFSVTTGAIGAGFHPALVVGTYITGVTWYARTEARLSSQAALKGAAGVMLVGLVLALPLPVSRTAGNSSPLFLYVLVTLGFVVGLPVCQAISRPTPTFVQAAVKRAIFSLVVLDAALATALAGAEGLVILLLLPPALLLGRWVYST